jgi:hypothetical protein
MANATSGSGVALFPSRAALPAMDLSVRRMVLMDALVSAGPR